MPQTVYSSCSLPYTTGCYLYSDSGGTIPVANGIFSDGTNTYTVTGGSGEITSVSTCAAAGTTTTTTTTTSTSTTSTSTTTTTTTLGVAQVQVSNTSSWVSIDSVEINTVPITYVSGDGLPMSTGQSGNFTSTEIGNYTITVVYTASSIGDNILIVDSAGTPYCQASIVPGNTITFLGAVVNTSNPVTVTASPGACA